MSSSEMGPAVMPSGGLEVRDLYSTKRRLDATLEAIVVGIWEAHQGGEDGMEAGVEGRCAGGRRMMGMRAHNGWLESY